MIDLARNGKDTYTKLQELSAREQISEKYLEGILGTLVRGKLLEGARGEYDFIMDLAREENPAAVAKAVDTD